MKFIIHVQRRMLDSKGVPNPATGNGPAPRPMEPAKQVPNRRKTMPHKHA